MKNTNQEFTIEELLDREGFVIHDVKGSSMLPLLDSSTDRVLLVKPDLAKIKIGDIALYKSHGDYVLHRICHCEDSAPCHCEDGAPCHCERSEAIYNNQRSEAIYTMRGDNRGFADAIINEKEIIAVLKGYWRGQQYSEDLEIKRKYPLIVLKLRDLLRRIYAKQFL